MTGNDVVVVEWRQVERLRRATVSLRAYALHTLCADYSRACEQPGFVPDSVLGGVPSDISLDVLELCMEGLWMRVGHGYFLLDVVASKV